MLAKMYIVHLGGRGSCMADKRSVVVTGASTGIGYAIAKVLGTRGMQVFGGVRKQSDADRLQRELGNGFTPVLMDVTDEPAVQAAAAQVGERLGNRKLFGLVNNAGIAGGGPLLHQPIDEFRRTVEVNLVGPFTVTKAFGPLLGADRSRTGSPGRIVQISSVAGKFAAPFLGVYAASKFGLEGMSESLRRELLLYGIDVIVVGPGSVKTPIFDKAQDLDLAQYDATEYGPILRGFVEYFLAESRKGLEPERIGEVVYTALTVRRPKLRYAVVPQPFKNWILPRMLPGRMVDRAIGKQSGLLPPEMRRAQIAGQKE
jgi:NAD(P)-dependent dehydrogenase (short-subunit alcohol dehydrogenase family)